MSSPTKEERDVFAFLFNDSIPEKDKKEVLNKFMGPERVNYRGHNVDNAWKDAAKLIYEREQNIASASASKTRKTSSKGSKSSNKSKTRKASKKASKKGCRKRKTRKRKYNKKRKYKRRRKTKKR